MTSEKFTLLLVFLIAQTGLFGQDWVQKSSLPFNAFGRHHPVTFSIGGFGYLVGGSASQSPYLSDFYRYDPVADKWDQLPNFPGTPRSYSYAVVYNGKAYMGFGFGPTSDLTDMWEYDPATGVWTEKSLCPGEGRGHPAYVEANGKIYIGLGQSSTGNMKDFWEYDIANDSWEEMPEFPSHRRHHPYHFAIDNMVYAGLGHGTQQVNGTPIYTDMYRFDPLTKDWERMSDFPAEARVAGTQFSLNGKGYVLSGEGEDHYYLEESEFWEYDSSSDSWTELPPAPGSGRWAPGSFTIGNTAYFTCGTALINNANSINQKDLWAYTFENATGTNQPGAAQTVQVYPNPAQDQLFVQGNWTTPTRFQIVHADGRLLQSGLYDAGTGIRIGSLPTGVYELMLIQATERFQAKFVKF